MFLFDRFYINSLEQTRARGRYNLTHRFVETFIWPVISVLYDFMISLLQQLGHQQPLLMLVTSFGAKNENGVDITRYSVITCLVNLSLDSFVSFRDASITLPITICSIPCLTCSAKNHIHFRPSLFLLFIYLASHDRLPLSNFIQPTWYLSRWQSLSNYFIKPS